MRRIIPVAALLLAAAPLLAQQTADPRPLSLADAVRVAEANNPAYRIVQSGTAVAAARERQALGAFLPSLSADLSLGGVSSRRLRGEDNFGRPLPSPEPVEQMTSSVGQSFSLSMTLFKPGQMGQLRAARDDRRVAAARVDADAVRTRAEVTRRYFQAQRAAQTVALEERLLVSAAERLEATRRLLRVGVRGPVDVLGAEVDVATQEQALEKARGEVRRTELALRETMGLMDGVPLRLITEPGEVSEPAAQGVDPLVAHALAAHPRIAQNRAAASASTRRSHAARWERLPSLSVRASFARDQADTDYDALQDFFTPSDRRVSVALGVSIPLFDQFRTTATVAQARADEARAREELRAAQLEVEAAVRGAHLELVNAQRASVLAARTVELARKRTELARQQYQIGATTFPELQDAVERAAKAERDALATRYDYAVALATLEEKVGAPVALP